MSVPEVKEYSTGVTVRKYDLRLALLDTAAILSPTIAQRCRSLTPLSALSIFASFPETYHGPSVLVDQSRVAQMVSRMKSIAPISCLPPNGK